MTHNIFYQNEIEYARSLLKTDCSDYVIIGEAGDYLFETLKDVFKPCSDKKAENVCVIGVIYGSDNKEKLLQNISDAVSEYNCRKCIICDGNSLKPDSRGITVSEREYIFLTDEKNIVEKIKEMSKKVSVNLLVFDEIIGPGCKLREKFCFDDGKITISDEDMTGVYGYTYIRDALSAIILASQKLKTGNIYNVSSFKASDLEIKQEFYKLFSESFSLECCVSQQSGQKVRALCSLKIESRGFVPTDMKDALYLTASSHYGFPYDYGKNLPQYCSKLSILKKSELEILKEIDRICKENDIKYFLTGGSLLGAVRYGHSIPWDDDLDIGMLREDFEKFRKICPEVIDKTRFAYASYTTEKNCHYLFDKIRLKNTYFSTEFSSQYKIQDGVFIDVFVYDTTSPSVKKQKFHINLVKTAIRFLNVKWTGKADKSMNGYKLSLIIKPFVRFISFRLLHSFSDKALMFYSKKKSDYLIDGTGLNINRGAFKRSFVEELTEMDFEGMKVPVPVNYDEFLKHVYGENYLEEPCLYQRSGTHNFVRLDLGEYITDKSYDLSEQSLDGELF